MKVAMIFPGYGSQYVGMGKELYDEYRVMQEYFEQASHCLDLNFIKLCFASSEVEIAKLNHAYTSLFLISSSIAAILKEQGIQPEIVAGYGIGQYAAMHSVNGLSCADGLYLLNKLASFTQEIIEQDSYEVIRIKGATSPEVENVLREVDAPSVHIDVFELPQQHILSGQASAIAKVIKKIKEHVSAAATEHIAVGQGLHSSVMLPAIEQLEIYFTKVDFKDIAIPLVANSSARSITQAQALKQEICDGQLKPILWHKDMQAIHKCDLILAIGPSIELVRLFQELYPQKQIVGIEKPSDITYVKGLIVEAQQKDKTDELIG